MDFSNLKKSYGKKILSLLMIMSFVFPLSFTVAPAPKAQAIFGIGDINIESIPQIVFQILDGIATGIARQMLGDVVNETITWANSGFEGGPAYVTNFRGFLDETVDAGVGDYIQNSESIAFLCEPLQRQVRNALSIKYSLGSGTTDPERNPFQCTLSGVVENVEDFYQSFSNGGWDAWFHITQNPVNNPYGAFFAADIDLSSKVAKQLDVERTLLDWADGTLSFRDCAVDDAGNEDRDSVTGRCRSYSDEVKTPGSVLAPQINNALKAGTDALITADSINGLFNAVLNGAIKLALSDRGFLRASNQGQGITRQLLDRDDDYVPDGWDYDGPLDEGHGELDTCSFGVRPGNNPDGTPLRPSNENCIMSGEIERTNYYVPICEDISRYLSEMAKFIDVIERERVYVLQNGEGSIRAETWINRISVINGVSNFLASTLNRYENPLFDEPTNSISSYSSHLSEQIGELAENNRLLPPSGNVSYLSKLNILLANSVNSATYFGNLQTQIEDCRAPNFENIGNVPPPPPIDTTGETVDGGSTTTTSVASCSANPSNVGLNQGVVWQATSSLTNPTFSWIGENQSGPAITSVYSTTGIKTSAVTVTGLNASGETITSTVQCSNSVTVQ